MPKTNIERLAEFGQSAWLDNINRSMIESGKLREMIGLGLRGMTSNPAIFDKSIRTSDDYDNKIEELQKSGKSTFEIYDDLTIRDVREAADIFREVYDKTDGLDGYVSLEVNPKLAFDTKATIEDGIRLSKKVNRPNVMFKIPATDPGFKAIAELLSEGININATLIFSLAQYEKTASAFLDGIDRLLQKGKDIEKVHSVASVFVSRIDTAADKIIETKEDLKFLKGKSAISNSSLIFKKYIDIFSGKEFKELRQKGANVQRVLWASTSTKNPEYSDIKYVTGLIAKNTVNTLPEDTFQVFLEHGEVKEALRPDDKEGTNVIDALKKEGVDVDIVCEKLLQDGIASFVKSFDALLASIESKAGALSR